MDLTFDFGNCGLNIRVVVIAKMSGGYIFEKHKMGHLYTIGGRIKINETSLNAAKREITEELGITIENLKLKGVLENFFTYGECEVHEISFIYETVDELEPITLPDELIVIPENEIRESNILPLIMKDIILSKETGLKHYLQEKI